MKKHTRAAPGLVNMSPHTFLPCIGRVASTTAGTAKGCARKKIRVGIGFKDDLTAGMVEEWNRVVDGARASLG